MTNATVMGEKLILDPREPQYDPTAEHVHLQFPPAAVCVKPSVSIQRIHNQLPNNTIPIDRITSTPFTITSADAKITITRSEIPITPAYAVTDYYIEGATISPTQRYLIHPDPPPDGHWNIASLYVMLTRYKSWDYVSLLKPLWSTDSQIERKQLIDTIYKKINNNKQLKEQRAELNRLALLATETIANHPTLYTDAQQYSHH